MKIGVVGGTGNISTSFVKLLLQLEHEVVCFNRGESGPVPEGARVIRGDRRADRAGFERAMQAERFDAAIDMICYTREDAESSLRAFRGVGHFVHCSTVCTYGVRRDWLPVTEDHPLYPVSDYGRRKVEADSLFLEAHYREGFPTTIIKPAMTYGPKSGMLRQISWEFSWIDRVRKGKPIVVCGDGNALCQQLHVDDAAACFAYILGRPRAFGQIYNMVAREVRTWADYHRTMMQVLGREVELVGVPFEDLLALDIPASHNLRDEFAYHTFCSAERLFRDVPEFGPRISLAEGMAQVVEAMDRDGRIPNSDEIEWEDRVIAAQRQVRQAQPRR
jgi:nucleoside-diphosphate-sugar epimerase